MPADVFHGEVLAGLVGMDGHVLGAMVGVDAADVLHGGDAGHVGDQDDQPDDALDEVADHGGFQVGVDEADGQQGKDEKYADAQGQGDGHCDSHGPLASGGVGSAGVVGLAGGDDGGPLQGLHAVPQGFAEDQDAAHHWNAADASGETSADRLGVAEDVAVRAAHGQAVVAHPADHDAFDHRLAAVQRPGGLGTGGLGVCCRTSHPACARLRGTPSRRRLPAAATWLRRTPPQAGHRPERRRGREGRLPGDRPVFRY